MQATIDFYRQREYWANGLTHFSIDFLNSGRNLAMALLAVALGLSNAQLGIVLLVYNIGSALLQPFFGWLTDRVGARWLVIGGLAWMIVFSTITALASDWIAVIALTLSGIGSGAFHPAGATVATRHSYRNRSRATSLFFVMGMSGMFLGPVVAGFALDAWSRPGYLLLPLIVLLPLVGSMAGMRGGQEQGAPAADEGGAAPAQRPVGSARRQRRAAAWLPLALLIFCYSGVGVTILTYLPKHYADLGRDLNAAGTLVSIYLFGGMLGNLLGGILADRWGSGKRVIMLGMGAAVVPLFLGLSLDGNPQRLMLFLAGIGGSMPHSILVLLVQSMLPRRRGFASGLALGGMFFSGSIGSIFFGMLGDRIGLARTLPLVALLPLCAFFLATRLAGARRRPLAAAPAD